MRKEKEMEKSFLSSESQGKKAWQKPSLTEVDYKDTRSGGGAMEDMGGYS